MMSNNNTYEIDLDEQGFAHIKLIYSANTGEILHWIGNEQHRKEKMKKSIN